MRRVFALSVLLLVSLACCSGSTHKTTSPTTADGPNPDVIPTVITPAYVDAVFNVIDRLQGDANRTLLASHAITSAVETDIRAIYNDPLYGVEIGIAQQSVGTNLSNIRNPPGDVRITVIKLISGSASCVFVQTVSDYSALLIHTGKPVASEYWALRLKQSGDDPYHLNPTPWALAFNADYLTPTSIPNQCGAS